MEKIKKACEYIKSKLTKDLEIGMILGSGLGVLADEIKDPLYIDYKDIPNFPVSTVEGHAGRFVIGDLNGKQVMIMQGRFHYYEGYTMKEVTMPVRVMKLLGIETIIVTNACGGMNKDMLYPGALMLIKDHINFTGDNPLMGPNMSEFGVRFPDMSEAYKKDLRALAKDVAKDLDIDVKEGIYASVTGPYYFSNSELVMLKKLGADVIGMSTVPEVIVANHSNMNVLGISCITDMAVGEEKDFETTHEEVMAMAEKSRPKFIRLVKEVVKRI
ncbi:MAG: purine-nucleoside phosphorylase [Peptostreptococcaceae bacterium]|jgi:purine-nucleoside phosphorylase|nr:purine-nucleoside phosphorylase [Peptostreptococcaceae bacterium]